MVFYTHFARGFSLPASLFFCAFLDFFGLQLHNLGANAVLQLGGFAMQCEGFLGLMPNTNLWAKPFFLKQQGAAAVAMSDCGAAVVTGQPNGVFPKLPLEDSVKNSQKSFFYVRNINSAVDLINLPPFINERPHIKLNRGYQPKNPSQEILNVCSQIKEMTAREGLSRTDLIRAFTVRQVLPLQRRVHRMCEISGRHDPCRMTTRELNPDQITERVNKISKAGLVGSTWRFGKAPYDRQNSAPAVSPWSLYLATSMLFLRLDAMGELQLFASQQNHDD